MKWLLSWFSLLNLEIVSADVSGLLSILQRMGVSVSDVELVDPLTLRVWIHQFDYRKISSAIEKHGDAFRVAGQRGIAYRLSFLRRRPVLVLGMLCVTMFFLWIPSRVFFVKVEGNQRVPALQIIQTAESCGIGFGASRREVRSEQMKNSLLEAMPELQWAGVNTYACTAVITVRERNDREQKQEENVVSSIVAQRDGIVMDMTVIRGNALCRPGQAVKAGQTLISAYTDSGISIRADRAEGEVFGQTRRVLTVFSPSETQIRVSETVSHKKYSLIIGKNRINFHNSSGILDATCAKIYSEEYVTLPGGFVLPIAIVTEEWICYETDTQQWQEAVEQLQPLSERYLCQQMISGRIDHRLQQQTQMEKFVRLKAIYTCYELIGISRIEENFEKYGKNN